MKRDQNLTIRLTAQTIRQAKILAAGKGSSVSRLVTETIERLVAEDAAYSAAQDRALAALDKGYHLGGKRRATRDELHER